MQRMGHSPQVPCRHHATDNGGSRGDLGGEAKISGTHSLGASFPNVFSLDTISLQLQSRQKRSFSRLPSSRSRHSSRSSSDGERPADLPYEVRDPLWDDMWYLNRGRGLHMGVAEAWARGVSGRGVAVTILDDGIEKDHPDLIRNYDPLASTDINDNDADPNPR